MQNLSKQALSKQPLTKQAEMGVRWLRCGWRLFTRNPWLLAGMGLVAMVIFLLLALIPLFGGLLIALFAPILLASAYLTADTISKQKMALPVSLAMPALARSPKALLCAFGDETHVIPLMIAAIYTLAAALFIQILVYFVTGGAWVGQWSGFGIGRLLGVLLAAVLALGLYLLLGASLIYALPLVYFQDQSLATALKESMRASVQHAAGVGVIFFVLVIPLIFGAVGIALPSWIAGLFSLLIGMIALPLVVMSAYCSYRTLFPSASA